MELWPVPDIYLLQHDEVLPDLVPDHQLEQSLHSVPGSVVVTGCDPDKISMTFTIVLGPLQLHPTSPHIHRVSDLLHAQPVLLHRVDIQPCRLSRQADLDVEGEAGGVAGTIGEQGDLTLVM